MHMETRGGCRVLCSVILCFVPMSQSLSPSLGLASGHETPVFLLSAPPAQCCGYRHTLNYAPLFTQLWIFELRSSSMTSSTFTSLIISPGCCSLTDNVLEHSPYSYSHCLCVLSPSLRKWRLIFEAPTSKHPNLPVPGI